MRFVGDRTALDREIESLRRYTDQLEKQGIKVKVDAETGRATREVDGFRSRVAETRKVLDQVVAGLRGDGGAFNGLAQSLTNVKARADGSQGALGGMAGGLSKMLGMAGSAVPVLGQLGLAAMGFQAIFQGVTGAINGALRPLEQLSQQAGQFNKQVAEGSVFAAQSFAVIGPDGKAIEGTANQMRALRGRITAEFQEIQKETAQISGATSGQIYEAFNILSQNNSGLGKAGEDLSNITKLSTRVAAAMNTLNIPQFQLRSEVTSLATGQVQAYDQLGMKLYGAGAGEKIRALQAEGKFYDDLMQKLEKLYDGQKVLAQSLENVKSNYADVFESIASSGGQSFERGLARSFQSILTPLNQLKGTFGDAMRSVGESLEPLFALAGLLTATLVPIVSMLASALQVVADILGLLGNLTNVVILPVVQTLVGGLTVLAKLVELLAALVSALLRPVSILFRVLGQQGQAAANSPFESMATTLDGLITKADRLADVIAKPFIAAAQAAEWLKGKMGGKSDKEIAARQADIAAEFGNQLGTPSNVTLKSITVSPLARQMQQEAEQRYQGAIPEEKALAKAKELSEIKERMYRNEITSLEQGLKLLTAQKALQESFNQLADARRGLVAKAADFRVSLASSPEAKRQAEDSRNNLMAQQEQQRIRERSASLQAEKAIQQQQLEISLRQAAIQAEQLQMQRAEIQIQRLKVSMAAQEFQAKARNAAAGSSEQKALLANYKTQTDILKVIDQQLAAANTAVALSSAGEANLRRTNALELRRLDLQQGVLDVQRESASLNLEQQRLMSSLNQREQAIKNELQSRSRIEQDLQRARQQDLTTAQKAVEAQQRLEQLERARGDLAKARADAAVKEAEGLVSLAKAQSASQANPGSVEAMLNAQIEAIVQGRQGFISEAEAVRTLADRKADQLRIEQEAARQQQKFQQEREASEQRIALLQMRVQQVAMRTQLLQLQAAQQQLQLQGERDALSRATAAAASTPAEMVAAGFPAPRNLNGVANMLPGTRGGPNINEGVGYGRGRLHAGQDLGLDVGDPIHSRRAGTVARAYNQGFGKVGGAVVVKYDDGTEGTYGHVNPGVKVGQSIAAGQRIATVAPDGKNTHLHYELRDAVGKLMNPLQAIKESLRATRAAPRSEVFASAKSGMASSTSFAAREQFLISELIRRGFKDVQVAAIMGSARQESSLDPSRRERGGTGLGLFQWSYDRRKDVPALTGNFQTDARKQLDLFQKELATSERVAGAMLKSATTLQDAAAAMKQFERYGVPGNRYNYMEDYQRRIQTGQLPGPGVKDSIGLSAGMTVSFAPDSSLENSLKDNAQEAAGVRESMASLTQSINDLERVLIPQMQERQAVDREALATTQAEQTRALQMDSQRTMLQAQISTPRVQQAAQMTETTVQGISGAIRSGFAELMRGGDFRGAIAQSLAGLGEQAGQLALDALLKPLEGMLTRTLFSKLSGVDGKSLEQQAAAQQQNAAMGQQQAARMSQQAAQMLLQGAQSLSMVGANGGMGGMGFGSGFGGLAAGFSSNLFTPPASAFSGGSSAGFLGGGGGGGGLFGSIAQMGLGLIGGVLGFRDGGIVSPSGRLPLPSYAGGGVASGSRGGYTAMLHGTEAVVPLPGGKSIPVDFRGPMAAMGQGGSSIAVHVDARGTQVEGDERRGGDLGRKIAEAVKAVIVQEKRPGGELESLGRYS